MFDVRYDLLYIQNYPLAFSTTLNLWLEVEPNSLKAFESLW